MHEIGNKNNGGQLYASSEEINVQQEELTTLLQHYFLKPFTQQEFWQFTSSNGDVNLNPVYSFAQQIFQHPDSFHFQSINCTFLPRERRLSFQRIILGHMHSSGSERITIM